LRDLIVEASDLGPGRLRSWNHERIEKDAAVEGEASSSLKVGEHKEERVSYSEWLKENIQPIIYTQTWTFYDCGVYSLKVKY
jgi:hypothetical protein